MKTLRLLFAVVFLLNVAYAAPNAVPFVQQPLIPASVTPGSPQFTLTVNGTGFASTAVVTWNGATRVTSFISSKQLQAQISAEDVATAGTVSINVVNPSPGGGTSNTVFFPIQTRAPSVAMAISSGFSGSGSTVAGDFNNDGKLDLAAGQSNSTGFYINTYLGNGDGTFQAPFPNHSVTPVQSMVTGDFNGDGKLDLVVLDDLGNVTIFLNHGNGIFVQKQSFRIPATGLVVGDFNGDGKLDFVTAGFNAYIFLGNGDGTFATPQSIYAPYRRLGGLAVGDFNGDGKLDLAISDPYNGSVDVLLGNGDGTFQTAVTYRASGEAVAVADINGDGKLDIVTNGISVLLGNGDGTFRNGGGVSGGGGYISPVIADFNGDGKLDVAVLYGSIKLFLGNGDGTFQSPLTLVGSDGASTLTLGDFNNDGKLDLVGTPLYLQVPVNLLPQSLNFGSQNVGTKSSPQNVVATNVGASTLTLTGITFGGSDPQDFTETDNCGTSLPSGANCQISVFFQPQAEGQRSATLNFNYQGFGSPQTVGLSGVGSVSTVTLTPSKFAFSTELVGTSSAPQIATLTNTGNVPVNISSISTTAEFTQTNNCPSSLPVGSSCQIQVEFAPTSPGFTRGTLNVADSAQGSPQQVALSGVGTVVKLEPLEVNFGDQQVGTQSTPAQIQLNNVGTTSLSISSISIRGTNPRDFSQTNNCGTSVPAGGSCTITVTFTPRAKGKRSATVWIQDDGGASPQKVPLTGTGT